MRNPDQQNAGRPPGKPGRDLVELLEAYLERARSGELLGVAVAAETRDGVSTAFAGTAESSRHTLAGAVAGLGIRLLREDDDMP